VPWLEDLICGDGEIEDEVQFTMTEEISKNWQLVPDRTSFFKILEKLCLTDETVVRDMANKAFKNIAGEMSSQEI
jgi:hypothetical protein